MKWGRFTGILALGIGLLTAAFATPLRPTPAQPVSRDVLAFALFLEGQGTKHVPEIEPRVIQSAIFDAGIWIQHAWEQGQSWDQVVLAANGEMHRDGSEVQLNDADPPQWELAPSVTADTPIPSRLARATLSGAVLLTIGIGLIGLVLVRPPRTPGRRSRAAAKA